MRSPTIFGIRLGVLVGFYRWRLRDHPVQELLAAAGIAVGVALVFGVMVANTSITGSARDLVQGLVGPAQLQLAARSTTGMDASLEARVATIPGVNKVAPVLREQATLIGPRGRQSVQIMGVTPSLAMLGGTRTEGFGRGGMRLADGLTLPQALGGAIGARAGEDITVLMRGSARRVVVGATLGDAAIGSLDGSPIAIAPLEALQQMAGMRGRVSQVLVYADPDAIDSVAAALRSVADDRLDVRSADGELEMLATTSRPNDLSTGLFAAISAMVGFLLAINAMLLTVPERRRWVAELRTQGFSTRQVLLTLGFDALILGLVASVLGVLLGDVLSRTLFNDVPAYLSFAFPVGTQRIVTTTAIVIALAGGIAATQLASILPALDLRSEQPDAILHQAGDAGEAVSRRATLGLAILGAAIAVLSAVASILIPPTTIVAGVMLAVSTLCFIPAGFVAVTRLLARVSSNLPRSMLPLALIELRATATRSIALACVAALAVYGCVAIQGARSDLIRGLDANFSDYLSSADLWITTGGDDLTTNSFTVSPSVLATIERLPETASLRTYQGGLLDVRDRRLWILGRAPDDRDMIPASQLVAGDLATAEQHLRGTGWATVSEALADSRGAQVGDAITLPTPAGSRRLRVAAITTNLGWPPGAVILGTTDYRRYWQTAEPSALQVDLKPGASLPAARAAIAAALRDGAPGLSVQTFEERRAQYAALSRQGLQSLKQIAVLLLIAAGLAVALALSAALWQRRPRLAELKAEGFSRRQLWRCVMLESAVVLALGGTIGALFGLYGHALASRWLQIATGFPAPFSAGFEQVGITVAALAWIALVTMAIPGYIATAVAPRATFQE